jgi:hypothetical protein
MTEAPTFEGWAILELMGHRKLGGYVREQNVAGAGFIRIDVPGKDGAFTATQLYSPGALYCLTPVAEDVARQFATNMQPEPVTRWELPPAREPVSRTLADDMAEDMAGDDDQDEEGRP